MPKSRSYRDELLTELKDPQEAQEYLNAALEDDDPQVFLLALRDVVDAHLGMAQLAEVTGRNRESLYRSLSNTGNPEWKNVRSILDSLGFKLAVETLSVVDAS
jgi:probable addiction module antidote protein